LIVIFAWFEHLGLMDAVYFTVTIVTTAVALGSAVARANVFVAVPWPPSPDVVRDSPASSLIAGIFPCGPS